MSMWDRNPSASKADGVAAGVQLGSRLILEL
jgi:hypothetical protein